MFILMIVILSLLMLAIRPVHLPLAFSYDAAPVSDDAPLPEEDLPLRGVWIDGKAPALTRQQPLIGDVKALSNWL